MKKQKPRKVSELRWQRIRRLIHELHWTEGSRKSPKRLVKDIHSPGTLPRIEANCVFDGEVYEK